MENSVKFWIIGIVILVLTVPFVVKANLVNRILYSNKSYAKQIEVKTYILTKKQVAALFNNPGKEPILFTAKELNNLSRKEKYCVISIKNLGERYTWGILSCEIPGLHNSVTVEIPSIEDYYCYYVVCISGSFESPAENSQYPKATFEWKALYTK